MNEVIKALLKAPIFDELEPSVLDRFAEHAHQNMHKKGKILFIHGDPAEHYYVVKSGHVKLFRETLDGTQAVIDVLSEDDIFGHNLLFEEHTYPYSAEVAESGAIISLPLSDLREEIYNNHAIAISVLRTITRQLGRKEKELEHRATQSTTQRIGCFLLRQALREKSSLPIIRLPYDKMLLAARLGMQPETFSRALSQLKKKNGIRIEGSFIHLESLDQLSTYACSSCSGKFPCKDLTHDT
jgi:CRP-like cAMP-binding protein